MSFWVAGAVVVGGVASYAGANKASKTAAKGQQAGIDELSRQYDQTRADLAPYRNIGNQALNALGSIYGYSPSAGGGFGADGSVGTPFSAALPQASVPGGSLNIGGQLTQKLGGLGKILDPAASIFGSKHGDERRNLQAFMADNQLRDLGNGLVALPDGRTFTKDQLQQVAGAYYGARYHPDGDQAGWQSKYDALLTAPQQAPQSAQASNPLTAPDYSAFFKSPDYSFRKTEGMQGIERSAAARGGAFSGNALRALDEFNSNLAAGEFGNYFNRQAALAGIGQTATNTGVQAGNYSAANTANLLGQQGDARASGVADKYNAIGSTLSQLGGLGGYYFGGRKPNALMSGNYGYGIPMGSYG
jgi:hypothetical protein